MKYRIPSDNDCLDLLTDAEFKLCGGSEKLAIARGRKKAWAEYRANGPIGRLRDLAQGAVGDSHLFTDYTRSSAMSPLIASVSLSDGVQFSCKLERDLIDGKPIGVRVTLVAFTR